MEHTHKPRGRRCITWSHVLMSMPDARSVSILSSSPAYAASDRDCPACTHDGTHAPRSHVYLAASPTQHIDNRAGKDNRCVRAARRPGVGARRHKNCSGRAEWGRRNGTGVTRIVEIGTDRRDRGGAGGGKGEPRLRSGSRSHGRKWAKGRRAASARAGGAETKERTRTSLVWSWETQRRQRSRAGAHPSRPHGDGTRRHAAGCNRGPAPS